MILKFRTGNEKWKYLEDISEPEVETVSENTLVARLGYTDERLNKDEIEIDLSARENTLKLLDSVPPIDMLGIYTGELKAVLMDIHLTDDSGLKPKSPPFQEKGQLMLAITCFKNNTKLHIFTNCETYLMNDMGKNINRLL